MEQKENYFKSIFNSVYEVARPLIDHDVSLVFKDSKEFNPDQEARTVHFLYTIRPAVLEVNNDILSLSKFEQRSLLFHEFTHIIMRNSQEFLESDKDNPEFRHMERDTDKMAIFINKLLLGGVSE